MAKKDRVFFTCESCKKPFSAIRYSNDYWEIGAHDEGILCRACREKAIKNLVVAEEEGSF